MPFSNDLRNLNLICLVFLDLQVLQDNGKFFTMSLLQFSQHGCAYTFEGNLPGGHGYKPHALSPHHLP